MRIGMDCLKKQVTLAEARLGDSEHQANKIQMLLLQMVPRTELKVLQAEFNKLREQSIEAEIAAVAAASASASEKNGVIEQLNKLLKLQQEECAVLQDRLQVRMGRSQHLLIS